MTADQILGALRAHYKDAALVPEVVIRDTLREDGDSSVRRIDALMFESLQRTAIEIKVTKADLKRETFAKTRPWRMVTHRFYYAIPAGFYQNWLRLFPSGCGVWEIDENGKVATLRKASINPYPEHLPQHVVQSLAYRAVGQRVDLRYSHD